MRLFLGDHRCVQCHRNVRGGVLWWLRRQWLRRARAEQRQGAMSQACSEKSRGRVGSAEVVRPLGGLQIKAYIALRVSSVNVDGERIGRRNSAENGSQGCRHEDGIAVTAHAACRVVEVIGGEVRTAALDPVRVCASGVGVKIGVDVKSPPVLDVLMLLWCPIVAGYRAYFVETGRRQSTTRLRPDETALAGLPFEFAACAKAGWTASCNTPSGMH